jgi:hypothetical protein
MAEPSSLEARSLPLALSRATKQHVVPIFRVDPAQVALYGTPEKLEGQGTMTLIKHMGRCFGVTNEHVASGHGASFMLALDRHTPLPGRRVFSSKSRDIDFPYDIAVFLLDEETILRGGKEPIALAHEHCPVTVSEQCLAVGYPGDLRHQTPEESVHPLFHIVARAHLVSDRSIVLQEELPMWRRKMRFGGISGGAIFHLTNTGGYDLAGIIAEGRGQHDQVASVVQQSDIWVYGVPIGTAWLERILSYAVERGASLELQPLKFKVAFDAF